MKSSDKKTDFTTNIFYRFFIPTLLSSLCLALGNIADTLFVGISLGQAAVAALGFSAPIYMIYNVLDLAIAFGSSVTFTSLIAKGKSKEAASHVSQMITVAIVTSAVIAVLGSIFITPILGVLGAASASSAVYSLTYDYVRILFLSAPLFFINLILYFCIRCDNSERLASVGMVISNAVDFSLSLVLVVFLNMGVKGAMYSTIIGQVVGIVIYLGHFMKKGSHLKLMPALPKIKEVFASFKLGLSSSSQYLFNFFSILTVNNILISIGGESSVAVYNVAQNVFYIFNGLFDGMGLTVQPLAATFFAERNKAAVKKVRNLSLMWVTAIGAVFAVVVSIFAESICMLFGLDAGITSQFGAFAARMLCLSAVFAGTNIVMSYFYQSVGEETVSFIINLLRSFIIYITAFFTFSLFGVKMFWVAFPIIEAISLLIWLLVVKLRSLKKGKAQVEETYTKTIRNKNEELGTLLADIEAFCEERGANFKQIYYVNLIVEEICGAIMQNGFKNKKDGYIQLTLVAAENQSFELYLRDNADMFDPFSLNGGKVALDDGQDSSNMDALGIMLVKKNAKDFFYRNYQGFNTLTVKV